MIGGRGGRRAEAARALARAFRAHRDAFLARLAREGERLADLLREVQVIFEKFGRATAAPPRTGLGLFLARSIAEAHGGSVTVASQPGRGATFTLTFPAGGVG